MLPQEESGPPARGRARGRLATAVRGALQLALVGGALYLSWRLVRGLSWHDLAARLGRANPWLVVATLVLLVARFFFWDWRWRLACKRLEAPPGRLHSFFGLLSGACVNLVTPTARVFGGLIRARYVAHSPDRPFGRMYGAVLFDQVAHQVVMTAAAWLGFIAFAAVLGHDLLAVVAAVALVLSTLVVGWWIRRAEVRDRSRVVRFLSRRAAAAGGGNRQKLYASGKEAYQIMRTLLLEDRLRRQAVVLGLLYFFANAGAQWVAFQAIALPVDFLTVLLAVTLGTAAGALTGTPGGLGTTEAGMIVAFGLLGVPHVDALAGTLVFRGLHYASVLALGLPALVTFELHQHRRARRRRRESRR